MGGIGRQNPCPFQVGGGNTVVEDTYSSMRRALGNKGAGPEGGVEDEWRWIKAGMIAAAGVSAERAAMQHFPDRATDHLPVWEDNLLIAAQGDETTRRETVQVAYTAVSSDIIGTLTERLQAIDSTISIVLETEAYSINFGPGRYLRPRDGAAGYGPELASAFPCFSTHFITRVLWPGGIPDETLRARAETILNNVLPTWYDYEIINAEGCYADGFSSSYSDITGAFP